MDNEKNTHLLDCLCKRCGRRLRNPKAILEGYGRVCKQKATAEEEALRLRLERSEDPDRG